MDLPPLAPLKVFETAGRLENFTHAGRELGLSQAAVSQQIQVLEKDLGVVLFDRLHRKVALTPAIDHLGSHVLLDLQGRWDWVSWSQWAGEMGVGLPETIRVLEFNSFPLLTDAAVNSQGVALGWKYLSDSQLESGALIRLSEKSLQTDRGYYLVTTGPLSEPASEFCEWVKLAYHRFAGINRLYFVSNTK